MRIPASLKKGLIVGLGGTSIALMVGCAQKPSSDPYAEDETAQKASASDKPGWSDREKAEKAAKYAEDEGRDDARSLSATTPTEREIPADAWFLKPLEARNPPPPNQEQPFVRTSTDPERTNLIGVQPTQVQPRPIANPKPKNWGWNRAACGRG